MHLLEYPDSDHPAHQHARQVQHCPPGLQATQVDDGMQIAYQHIAAKQPVGAGWVATEQSVAQRECQEEWQVFYIIAPDAGTALYQFRFSLHRAQANHARIFRQEIATAAYPTDDLHAA